MGQSFAAYQFLVCEPILALGLAGKDEATEDIVAVIDAAALDLSLARILWDNRSIFSHVCNSFKVGEYLGRC